jgi:effector-binding domain-containing protein
MEPKIESRAAQPYAAIASTASMRDGGFGDVIDASLPAVLEHLASVGVEPAGPPLVIYREIDMGGDLQIEVGWPVAAEIPPDDRVGSGTLPRGRYVVGTHTGPYEGLLAANRVLQEWAKGQGYRWAMHGGRWDARYESYLTDPLVEPDQARWQTEIAYLVAH